MNELNIGEHNICKW